METSKPMISATQLAKRLGVARDQIPNLREKRGLPYVQLKKRIMYPVAAIDKWVEAITQTNATK